MPNRIGCSSSRAHNELTTCISTSKWNCLSSLARPGRVVRQPRLAGPHTWHGPLERCSAVCVCCAVLSMRVCCIRTFHAANDVFIWHVSSPHIQPVRQSIFQSVSQPRSQSARHSFNCEQMKLPLRGLAVCACDGLVHCKCSQFL